MIKRLKSTYYLLENTYYDIIEKINKYLPITKIIDPIEKYLPSFPLVLITMFLVLGFAFFTPQAEAGNIYSLQILNKENGQPIDNLVVFIDGEKYKTDEKGRIFLQTGGKKKITIKDKNYEEKNALVFIDESDLTIYLAEKTESKKYTLLFYDAKTKKPYKKQKHILIRCENGEKQEKETEYAKIEVTLNCKKPVAKITAQNCETETKPLEAETKFFLKEKEKFGLLQVQVLLNEKPAKDIEINAQSRENSKIFSAITSNNGIAEIRLPIGRYNITATNGETIEQKETEIFENDISKIQINLQTKEGGRKKFAIQLLKDGEKVSAVIKIYKRDVNALIMEKETDYLEGNLEDGEYWAFIFHNTYVSAYKLNLFEGKEKQVQEIELKEGERRKIEVQVLNKGEIAEDAQITYYFKTLPFAPIGSGKEILLRPGEYIIKAKDGDYQKTKEINLTQDSSIKINLNIGKGNLQIEVYDKETGEKITDVYGRNAEAEITLYDIGENKEYKEVKTTNSIAEIKDIPADKIIRINAKLEGIGEINYPKEIYIEDDKTIKIKIYLQKQKDEISFEGIKTLENTEAEIAPETSAVYYLEFYLPQKGKYFIETENPNFAVFTDVEGLVLAKKYFCNQPISNCLISDNRGASLLEIDYDNSGQTKIKIKTKISKIPNGSLIKIKYYKENQKEKTAVLVVGERECKNKVFLNINEKEEIVVNKKSALEISFSSCEKSQKIKINAIIKQNNEELVKKTLFEDFAQIDEEIKKEIYFVPKTNSAIEISVIAMDNEGKELARLEETKEVKDALDMQIICPQKVYLSELMSFSCRVEAGSQKIEKAVINILNLKKGQVSEQNVFITNQEGKAEIRVLKANLEQPIKKIIVSAQKQGYKTTQTEVRVLDEYIENADFCLETEINNEYNENSEFVFYVKNNCNEKVKAEISSVLIEKWRDAIEPQERKKIEFRQPSGIGIYPLYIKEELAGISSMQVKQIKYSSLPSWLSINPNLDEINNSLTIENKKPIFVDSHYPEIIILKENNEAFEDYGLDKLFGTKIERKENILAENLNLRTKEKGGNEEPDCFSFDDNSEIKKINILAEKPVNLILYKKEGWTNVKNYNIYPNLKIKIEEESGKNKCFFELIDKDGKPEDLSLIFNQTEKNELFDNYIVKYDEKTERWAELKGEINDKNAGSCLAKIKETLGEKILEKTGRLIDETTACTKQGNEYVCKSPQSKNTKLPKTKTLRIAIDKGNNACGFAVMEDWDYVAPHKRLTEIWDRDYIKEKGWKLSRTNDFLYFTKNNNPEQCIKEMPEEIKNKLEIADNPEINCSEKISAAECRNYYCYNCYVEMKKEENPIKITADFGKELCLKAQKINNQNIGAEIKKIYAIGEKEINDYSKGEKIKIKFNTEDKQNLLIKIKDYVLEEQNKAIKGKIEVACDKETEYPSKIEKEIEIPENQNQIEIDLEQFVRENRDCSQVDEVKVIEGEINAEIVRGKRDFKPGEKYPNTQESKIIITKNSKKAELKQAEIFLSLKGKTQEKIEEKVRVKYAYDWEEIGKDFCNPETNENYYVCDQTQFYISFLKTITDNNAMKKIEDNGYIFKAALMPDNYNLKFRKDFAEEYKGYLVFGEQDWNSYLNSNDLFIIENNPKVPGLYDVELQIKYLHNKEFFWDNQPNAKIKIKFHLLKELKNYFYTLPLNGHVGIKDGNANRTNYGLAFNRIPFDLDAEIMAPGFAKKTIQIERKQDNLKAFGFEGNKITIFKTKFAPALCLTNTRMPNILWASKTECQTTEEKENKENCYWRLVEIDSANSKGAEITIPPSYYFEIEVDPSQEYIYKTKRRIFTKKYYKSTVNGLPEKENESLSYKCPDATPLALTIEHNNNCFNAIGYNSQTNNYEKIKLYVNDMPNWFKDNRGKIYVRIKICPLTEAQEEQTQNIENQDLNLNTDIYNFAYLVEPNSKEQIKCNGVIVYMQKNKQGLQLREKERVLSARGIAGYEIRRMQDIIDYINKSYLVRNGEKYIWNKDFILNKMFGNEIKNKGFEICQK